MKDLRGFTLIELLAVIVVLAIIMLIAVNAVLPQMDKARKSSFAIEANGAIQAAQTYFMSQNLTEGKGGLPTNDGDSTCVTIADLIKSGDSDLDKDDYEGKVIVTKGTGEDKNLYFYQIWLHKKSSNIVAITNSDYDDIEGEDIKNGSEWKDEYNTCS